MTDRNVLLSASTQLPIARICGRNIDEENTDLHDDDLSQRVQLFSHMYYRPYHLHVIAYWIIAYIG